ncbi:hypothetical protein BDR05DRAFT_948539 [Suillus weaverae]|nr:hypothetical protein BDR05DRAFT_948539 [Suillus weaverae]
MGPPVSIGNNIPPGPSVIIEDIHNMGPWSAGPYNTEFVTEGALIMTSWFMEHEITVLRNAENIFEETLHFSLYITGLCLCLLAVYHIVKAVVCCLQKNVVEALSVCCYYDKLPGHGFVHGDGCPASPGMGIFISTSLS